MNPSPNREVALFSAALELPAGQRAAYLERACADDSALRLRLEALLRIHEKVITFLENPVPGAQESPMGAGAPDTGSPAEKAGDPGLLSSHSSRVSGGSGKGLKWGGKMRNSGARTWRST